MTDKEKTAERLRKYMELYNLSQSDIARELKVSRQTVNQWTSGQTLPTVSKTKLLAKLLHVTVPDILVESTDSTDYTLPFDMF